MVHKYIGLCLLICCFKFNLTVEYISACNDFAYLKELAKGKSENIRTPYIFFSEKKKKSVANAEKEAVSPILLGYKN